MIVYNWLTFKTLEKVDSNFFEYLMLQRLKNFTYQNKLKLLHFPHLNSLCHILVYTKVIYVRLY